MTLRDRLAGEIAEIEWHWLRQHLERDAIIVVALGLGLAEAAAGVADDDTALVRQWIDAGRLHKPTQGELAAWKEEPAKRFRMLIVQPYVLIQEAHSEGDDDGR